MTIINGTYTNTWYVPVSIARKTSAKMTYSAYLINQLCNNYPQRLYFIVRMYYKVCSTMWKSFIDIVWKIVHVNSQTAFH
jgi:hypothetical protein